MESLDDRQRLFVEEMGLYFERNGDQRSLGRLAGVLLLADRPLSQEELMHLVGMSRTATSSGLRFGETIGFVEQVSMPGERRRYYQVRGDITDWVALAGLKKVQDFSRLLLRAEELARPGARDRLAVLGKFYSELSRCLEAFFSEWRMKRRAT